MEKTLGGDRLGSGKKMNVHLKGYERSTHDLSYLWRSTMSAGTLVPFLCKVALPGDTFDIDLQAMCLTHPTVGPLFGSYKVQLDIFEAPIRLYHGLLHNNKLGIGLTMSSVKLPIIQQIPPITLLPNLTPGYDIDNLQINPSALLSYLGIRGIGINNTPDEEFFRDFNGVPFLAYWEIYKNYYANKQENIGAFINNPTPGANGTTAVIIDPLGSSDVVPLYPATGAIALADGDAGRITYTVGQKPSLSGIMLYTNTGLVRLDTIATEISDTGTNINITFGFNALGYTPPLNTIYAYRKSTAQEMGNLPPRVQTFPLPNIDKCKEALLAFSATNPTLPFNVTQQNYPPYNSINNLNSSLGSQQCLALKTYQSDQYNNWLSKEWIDGVQGINAITAISTASGSFTIDTLQLSKKVYDLLNRVAVSGGSYDDWLDAVYDHDRFTRVESPIYHGGLSKELIFQEVVANAGQAEQPLGTLAGRGKLSDKHKGGKVTIKVNEPSYIIGIVSITPRIDYSQGNNWDVHLKTMDDLHKPGLDGIGFQDLLTEEMAWWTTYFDGSVWRKRSAGKQPAWLNYMTSNNKVYGNFAVKDNEMFMVLNRRYDFSNSGSGVAAIDIKDLTTYIDPSKFNNIFAETALDAQNFWMQLSVDITARRKMSAKIMPNL